MRPREVEADGEGDVGDVDVAGDVGGVGVGRGRRGVRRPAEGVGDLVGLSGDVPDVAGELGDEEEVSLGSQGPGRSGVGLGDGAGQGLMVGVYYQAPPFDLVSKLLDSGRYGEEFPIEGRIAGLGVR